VSASALASPVGRAGHGAPAAERRAVFVDKDGTLVHDVPYNVDPEQLRFTPSALAGLRALADAGFAIIVVTNQPGLATGRFSRRQFAALEAALCRRVQDEGGVEITAVYCCPHAPGPGGTLACLCRKPAPGLLRQAARAHRLDLARCWIVGDILDDVEAGHRAGCRSVLLDVGNETEWKLSPIRSPDARCADLGEAAQFILRCQAVEAAS
jgi:D-glycero-D-manno-heptose 1,7-bisphosphate phosphatase